MWTSQPEDNRNTSPLTNTTYKTRKPTTRKTTKTHTITTKVYYDIVDNFIYAAEIAGYDPINENMKAFSMQKEFGKIREFRKKYKDWYNSYKHGQRTIPIVVSLTNGQQTKKQIYGLYMIPRKFHEMGDKIFFEHSFLHSLDEVSEYVKMAGKVLSIWIDIRTRQYKRIFGT